MKKALKEVVRKREDGELSKDEEIFFQVFRSLDRRGGWHCVRLFEKRKKRR
jgi:hypothetical protein